MTTFLFEVVTVFHTLEISGKLPTDVGQAMVQGIELFAHAPLQALLPTQLSRLS